MNAYVHSDVKANPIRFVEFKEEPQVSSKLKTEEFF